MTSSTIERLKQEIREELEKGITRNNILPLDWAMDRIEPILEKGMSSQREDDEKEFEKCIKGYEENGYPIWDMKMVFDILNKWFFKENGKDK